MNCLISGGAGFIGSHIAEALVKQGHKVIVLDNMITGKMENLNPWWNPATCTFVKADISSYKAISPYFSGIDYVFHNAASKCTVCADDPRRDLEVNALGTLNVITAAHEAGVKKVIHASTGSVNEINSYYGNSKSAAEQYLRVFKNYYPDFTYTALRYHHVYGPRQDSSDHGGVIPIFIRQIHNDRPVTIFGDGKQVRHFTHVDDVVRANLFCIEHPETDNMVYNVLSDTSISIYSLVGVLGRLMGKSTLIRYEKEKPGDIKTFNVNSHDIEALGFEFEVPLDAGLKDTINWYLNEWRKAA